MIIRPDRVLQTAAWFAVALSTAAQAQSPPRLPPSLPGPLSPVEADVVTP